MDAESAQTSFLPVIAAALEGDSAAEWQVQAGKGDDDPWISAQPGDDELPEQGWKLHVSATAESSHTVLRRCLAVLGADPAAFKVAGSAAAVEFLNEGQAGLSQIGKFVTVYPSGDEQAVRLARELDAATAGLPGPQVPSDRPLRPGSLVHYRYGGFTERVAYTSLGQAVPTIRADGGQWVQDSREVRYERPDWVEDPFEAAGIAESEPSRAIAGRYAPVSTLHRSPRGATYLAVDLEEVRTVVLKHAGRGARARPGMGDARDQLRWEGEVLRRVGPDPRFPEALDLVEREDDVYLVLERLEGMPLGPWVTRGAASGLLAPREQIIEWGRELAAAIARIHDEGLVFRDLSPLNVIVGEDGRLRLIDFELAIEIGSPASEAVGTVGYASPQQYAGEDPSVVDDVYSLGGTLFLLATGTDPIFVEEDETFLERSLTALNPELGADLAAVIDRCRESDPSRRFSSAAEVAEALAALPAEVPAHVAPGGADVPVNRERYGELAAEIGDQLAAWVLEGESGAAPVSLESLEARMELAGAILALMALGPERVSRSRDAIAEGATRLARTEPTGAAGLYLGEGGIALALARAGRTLRDTGIAASGTERAEHLGSISARGTDLFGGAAGGLRSQLLIWAESEGAGAPTPSVIAAADALLASAEEAGDGGLRWRSPPDPGESTGALHVGYAHGTAGIADVLLDVAEASGERRFADAAAAAGEWVVAQALPALPDGAGVAWPEQAGGEATPPLWCRGATGIGRFLLHLSAAGAHAPARTMAERAASTVARGGRFLGPTSCHGLAGSAEFLVDVQAATGDGTRLAEADSLASLLEAFRDDEGVWRSDSGEPLPFDLLTGIAGVAMSLLRLSDPGGRRALLEPRRDAGRPATPTAA